MLIRELLGFGILAVQFLLVFPVVWGLLRAKVRVGYSVAGEWMWFAAGAGWTVYGLWVSSWALVASGVLAAVTSFMVGFLCWRGAGVADRRAAVLLTSAVGVGCVVGGLFWGVAGLSLALSVFGVVQFIPQIVKTLKAWRAVSSGGAVFGGVSGAGAVGRALYSLAWAVYAGAWFLWGVGFGSVDWPLLVWGVSGFVAFALQACLVGVHYRRSR